MKLVSAARVVSSALLCLIFSHAARAADFKAGAGAAKIGVTANMLPVEGYTVQHDAISARVLLLDDGKQRVALLVVDVPSIQDSTIESWRSAVARATGAVPPNVLVIASHDTSAPHVSVEGGGGAGPAAGGAPGRGQGAGPGGQPPAGAEGGPANGGGRRQVSPTELANGKAYAQAVDAAVNTAAAQAASTLQPATVGFGLGTSHINVNRDVKTPKGWATGYDDAGFTDPSLAVVRFNAADGKPLAWLMNYAVRPAILEQSVDGKDGKAISGDIVGAAEQYLESEAGAGVAIFLMGAAVDQSPYLMANRFVQDKDGNSTRVDIHDAGFYLVDMLGERLGSEAFRVSNDIKTSAATPKLSIVRQSVAVTSQQRNQPGAPAGPPPPSSSEPAEIPFVLVQIGDIALAAVAPELNANIGVKIKKESPFAHTIVVTMVDGSAKYLPDATNYDRKTPAALGSRYARGSAETVATKIDEALKQLHASK